MSNGCSYSFFHTCFAKSRISDIRKNVFACLFSVDNTIKLSRHEKVCLIRLRFWRYFSHHWATYMSRIFKGNMRTWTETIKLTDKKKFPNVTN